MLVVHPAFHLFPHIMPRDLQGQFTSNKLVKFSFASLLEISFPHTLECPGTWNSPTECWVEMSFNAKRRWMNVIPVRMLFCQPKSYQSCLTITAYTNVFLWSNIHMNFICTGQDNIYIGQENSSIYSQIDTEPSSHRLPIDNGPGSPTSWTHLYTRRALNCERSYSMLYLKM